MKLVVISPHAQHEYNVQWIEAHTSSGMLIVKIGHVPMISTLIPGFNFLFVLSSTDEKKIIHLSRPGFLEVNRTEVLVITSQDITLI
ncbi:MAG TPA: hypothetical protein VLB80_01650 [Candidatus Babeliales bacterium]|nr:hypothetical protein [Candidatus Babeliales bacterium]